AYLDPYVTGEAFKFFLSAPIPAMGLGVAKHGFVISTSFDWEEGENYAVDAVRRIVQGQSPAVIPVDKSTRNELFLNRRRARELGIEIPASLLVSAKQVFD